MMTYRETLDYLYTRLPMFSRVGAAAFKKDLTNIQALCDLLGHPEKQFRSVHIGGTNGKGSVSHMLAAVFQQAGYKTGLYTSPHLKDFRERIRVNGAMIPEADLTAFVDRLRPFIETIAPSFFEITVALAFDYFARQQVDVAIVEVGLGGRLDSTNIILPELSVITNISYDHQAMLGNTLPEIAVEKAGIIKPGVPAVIGETQPETMEVFQRKAVEEKASLFFADRQCRILSREAGENEITVTVASATGEGEASTFRLDLTGEYQAKNLCTALTALDILRQKGWILPAPRVREALGQVQRLTGLHGRWEVIGRDPLTVLDVAHNEAGMREVVQQLRHIPYRRLHIVTGFVKDKDISKVLDILPKDASYYFCKADIPRALDETVLKEMAAAKGLHGDAYPAIRPAFEAARQVAQPDDMILVCGSFFIVGEIPDV